MSARYLLPIAVGVVVGGLALLIAAIGTLSTFGVITSFVVAFIASALAYVWSTENRS